MSQLTDLTDHPPEEWDGQIQKELSEAGIPTHKFREYGSPNSWVEHTLQGKLGEWTFHRDETSYWFWGDIPLATAEVIARDPACVTGCVPIQWNTSQNKSIATEAYHQNIEGFVKWIDENGRYRVRDENYSKGYKEALQHDYDYKLLFVDDPSADGKPFVQTYTFFTQAALNNFIAICHRHCLEYSYTR